MTGVLADNAKGLYATDIIYDDTNADQIESLPDTQLHRDVDLAIVEADKQGETDIILSVKVFSLLQVQATSDRILLFQAQYMGDLLTLLSKLGSKKTSRFKSRG